MKKIVYIFIALIICTVFSMDDVSIPNRPTTGTTISLSSYLANLDSITTKTNRIKDTVENKFLRKTDLNDTVYDTLKAKWGKIDTVKSDSAYSRVSKSRVARNDTVYSDSTYARIGKNRLGRIDTLSSDTINTRVIKNRLGRIDTSSSDTVYSRVVKTRKGRIDTAYGDSSFYRVSKVNYGRIDTAYSDTAYGRVIKSRVSRSDTSYGDSSYYRTGKINDNLIIGYSKDYPAILFKRSTINYSSNQLTAFNIPDNLAGRILVNSNVDGGIFNVSYCKTTSFNNVFYGYNENDLTLGTFYFKSLKHNGSGGLTSQGNTATIFDVNNYNTNLFTIKGSGNVGILTTSPQCALHVTGTITGDSIYTPKAKIDTFTNTSKINLAYVDTIGRYTKFHTGRFDSLYLPKVKVDTFTNAVKFNSIKTDTFSNISKFNTAKFDSIFTNKFNFLDTGTFQCTLAGSRSSVKNTVIKNAKYAKTNNIIFFCLDSLLQDTVKTSGTVSSIIIYTNMPASVKPSHNINLPLSNWYYKVSAAQYNNAQITVLSDGRIYVFPNNGTFDNSEFVGCSFYQDGYSTIQYLKW